MSNILKRVLIGVAIGVILMLIKGNLLIGVSAKEMSTESFGGLQVAVNGTDNNYIWDMQDGAWENWGSGVLIGNGSIIKTNGQSTSSFATVRSVMAYSGNQAYVCRMGSSASNNSTYQNQTFTFECPMIMSTYGLQQVAFIYSHTGGTDFTMRLEVNGSMTFIKDDDTSGSSTTSAINNQITNDNTNTTNIINNNNQNTQQQIESQKVCSTITIDKSYGFEDGALNTYGQVTSTTGYVVTNYISLGTNSSLQLLDRNTAGGRNFCFYNSSKEKISCLSQLDYNIGSTISVPTGSKYARFTIQVSNNLPKFELYSCQNGNQALADGQQQLNDTLNNGDSTGATSSGSNFFLNFADHTNPLLDILLFPLRLLDSANDTCQSITLTYHNQNIVLPCGNTVFWDKNYASDFKVWWNLFVGGIAIYYLCLKLFKIVNDSFDPFKDPLNNIGGF